MTARGATAEFQAADVRSQAAAYVRGLSPPDALTVVFIASLVGVFLEPRWPVGVVLIAAIAGVYAAVRTTRGAPMRRRLLATTAVFVVPMLLAALLVNLGY